MLEVYVYYITVHVYLPLQNSLTYVWYTQIEQSLSKCFLILMRNIVLQLMCKGIIN